MEQLIIRKKPTYQIVPDVYEEIFINEVLNFYEHEMYLILNFASHNTLLDQYGVPSIDDIFYNNDYDDLQSEITSYWFFGREEYSNWVDEDANEEDMSSSYHEFRDELFGNFLNDVGITLDYFHMSHFCEGAGIINSPFKGVW